MTPIAVIAVGSKLPVAGFSGFVHGVFDHACNIRLADGHLATCTVADYFEMPRGIRIRAARGFKFGTVLTGGAKAYCRAGILRFDDTDLKIDLREATIWKPGFKAIARPSQRQLQILWDAAVGQTCFGLAFPKQYILALLAGLQNNQEYTIRQSLRGLIGLGPGLTPAGDDVVTAFLAAPKLIAPAHPWGRALSSFTLLYLHATNDISRQMLSDATMGHFIEPILSMMSAIYGTGHICHSTRGLLSVGATSGPAMLLGLLAGIAHFEGYQLLTTSDNAEQVLSVGSY